MAYDRVITDFNAARLRSSSYPIVHALIDASASVNPDVSRSADFQALYSDVWPAFDPPANPKLPHPR